jgi:glycosyltransferase involved in cell wall biosynthesis
MSAPLRFSVVICTYLRYALLEKAVASVLAQSFDPDLFDLWILDNSPDGPEREKAREKYAAIPRVTYVALDRPGLSNARNEGIRRSKGDIVVFLDDDAVAKPSWLASYAKAFDELGPLAGAIGGKTLPDFETPRPSWLSDQSLIFLSVADWYPDLRELTDGRTPVGANMAARREALLQAGGFPVTHGRSGDGAANLLSGEEDMVFSRLRLMGWKLFYAPDAEVSHFIPSERLTRSWFRRRLVWQSISDQMASPLRKDYEMPFWAGIVDYIHSLPREQIPFMGLCWDADTPEAFDKQLNALRYLIRLLAAFGDYPDEMKKRIGS